MVVAYTMRTFVILHNVRSAHNVGSIFRTADGAGVTKLYLTGYTPAPIDRFGRLNAEIEKTSLGATQSVSYESHESIEKVLEALRASEVALVSVEQHARAVPYTEYVPKGDTAFIFGNEIEGVPSVVCESADEVIHIPMHGQKESLNVGVAAGIVLFSLKVSDWTEPTKMSAIQGVQVK